MDTVTYPNSEVARELEARWLSRSFDVTESRSVAALFGVVAIPTAIAVRGDGFLLGRVQGFVPPEEFQKKLAALRGKH